jgi:hypothetical protein
LPAIPAITPEPAPPLVPPAPVPEPAPAPPTAPAAKGPVLVAPTAVVRNGGATPKLSPSRNEEIPANVAAKLCIDAAGRVTSVDLLTKLERAATASDLTSTLKGWTYTPYKQQGVAVPACFVVNFHTK